MNGQEYVAYQPPKFTEMTKKEIVNHFAKYCFVDQEGYKLEQCDEFIQLIECVVTNE